MSLIFSFPRCPPKQKMRACRSATEISRKPWSWLYAEVPSPDMIVAPASAASAAAAAWEGSPPAPGTCEVSQVS